MMALDDLRSFVEVVQSGGFNRAAKRLGISKSIVSRRMARLEAELGSRLLSRTTRGISPTEAGLELKVRSERIPCRARGGTRGGCTAVRRGGWPPSPLSPAVLRRAPRGAGAGGDGAAPSQTRDGRLLQRSACRPDWRAVRRRDPHRGTQGFQPRCPADRSGSPRAGREP
jgi:Bacterial regulatory helix-turn-helix protein, lysR family